MAISSGITQPLEKEFRALLAMTPEQIMASGAKDFLKIAALTEQQSTRNTAPVKAPQGTVAERVVQQSMSPPGAMGSPFVPPTPLRASMPPGVTPPPPNAVAQAPIEQGVGSLPADMTMASGGIVSFAGGGGTLEEYRKRGEAKISLAEDPYSIATPYFMERENIVERGFKEPELSAEEFRELMGSVAGGRNWFRNPSLPKRQTPTPLPPDGTKIEELGGLSQSGSPIAVAGIPTISTQQIGAYKDIPKPLFKDRSPERAERLKEAGLDAETYYAQQAKGLEGLKKDLLRMRNMSGGEALINAGQAIASADPTKTGGILGALTQGLGAYAQSRRQSNKDVMALQRMVEQRDMLLAEAKRSEMVGDIDRSIKFQEEADKMGYQIDVLNTQGLNERTEKTAELNQAAAIANASNATRAAVAQTNAINAMRRATLKAQIDANKPGAQGSSGVANIDLLAAREAAKSIADAEIKRLEDAGRPVSPEKRNEIMQNAFMALVQQLSAGRGEYTGGNSGYKTIGQM